MNLAVGRTEAELSAAWNKATAEAVRSWGGTLNESHRLFVYSADLAEESQISPWTTPGCLGGTRDEAKVILKWVRGVANKVSDFIAVFDGRNLSNRRFLEEEMGVASSSSTTSELCVMYRQNHSSRPGRKVFGSSPSRETGYLCGQVARVRLTTVERKEGQQSQ